MLKAVVLTQAFATFAMVGVIGCIQLVHYPMFARLDREQFCQSIRWHGNQITYLVFPLMTMELLSSLWLVFGQNQYPLVARTGLGLVVGIWACTGLVQVPLHSRLSQNHDPHAIEYLVGTNWLRTLMWGLRIPLVLFWLC
jgi:hypothetical protein